MASADDVREAPAPAASGVDEAVRALHLQVLRNQMELVDAINSLRVEVRALGAKLK